MKENPEPKLLCMCRCHRRAKRLEMVLNFWASYVPMAGVDTRLVISPDRATKAVWDVIAKFRDHPRVLGVCPAPVPVLSLDGQPNWMPGHNAVLEYADQFPFEPDWMVVADDDRIFEGSSWTRILEQMLREPLSKVAAYYFASIMLWDTTGPEDKYSIDAYHWAPLLGRYEKGLRHREDMVLAVVKETHKLLGCGDFSRLGPTAPFYMLDFSGRTPKERRELFKYQAQRGFQDNWTRRLIHTPTVLTLGEIQDRFPTPIDLVNYQFRKRDVNKQLTMKDLYVG